MYHSRLVSVLLIVSFVLNLCAGAAIYPKSLATQKGSVSDVSLSALQSKDQSGDQDSWAKYVEFYGSSQYQGVFTFDASDVDASAVGAYTLEVNFKGPKKNSQSWSFELFDASSNSWVDAGDNSDAASWSWTSLSFCGSVEFASLVNNGNIQVRLTAESGDDCDLDYLAIHTTEDSATSGSNPATAAPTQKAATQAPTQKAATAAPTKAATQAPTQKAATAAPTKAAATQKPTKAPATPKPTPKPTQKATVAPTQKAATAAPTQKATAAPTQKASTPAPSTGGRICPANQVWSPAPGTTWQWQLTGTIDQSFDVQMYDIDLFDASASLITQLHGKGRAVICYFSTQYENWRSDAGLFTSAVLGNNLDDWPGERYADIRSSVVRSIMQGRLDMAVQKGCDGVEPDNVDAYANSNGLGLTAADQLDFNKFMATEGHKRGLSVGLKNDVDQVKSLVSNFDWALNEQCNQYSECSVYSNFVSAGKAVFGVEYSGSASKFCPTMVASQFSWLLKGLDLDAKIGAQCCTYAAGGCATKPAPKCVTYNAARDVMEAEEESAIVAEEEALVQEALVAEPELAAEPAFDSAASAALPVMAVVLAAAVALVM